MEGTRIFAVAGGVFGRQTTTGWSRDMTHLGLFEGIGGFSLAARTMGWDTVAWSEINPFCRTVLQYHFPEAEPLGDITKTDFTRYANKIDILTGGFPCQPYSLAGKRKGKDDERHLWPQMLRAIREIKPRWVVGENVFGIVSWDGGMVFEEVQADLENEWYEVQPFILPACAVDAPHRRDRVWFVGYAKHNGLYASEVGRNDDKSPIATGTHKIGEFTGTNSVWSSIVTNADSIHRREQCQQPRSESEGTRNQSFGGATTNTSGAKSQRGEFDRSPREKGTTQTDSRQPSRPICSAWENFPTQPPICGGDDGIPRELDTITFPKWRNEAIKALGNAIVPQVALQIFRAIKEYERIQ